MKYLIFLLLVPFIGQAQLSENLEKRWKEHSKDRVNTGKLHGRNILYEWKSDTTEVETSSGKKLKHVHQYQRGSVMGKKGSLFIGDLLSDDTGDWDISGGTIKRPGKFPEDWSCEQAIEPLDSVLKISHGGGQSAIRIRLELMNELMTPATTTKLVRLVWEMDYNVYTSCQTLDSANKWMASLAAQYKALAENDNIHIQVVKIFIWDTPSGYSGTSQNCLYQFINKRQDWVRQTSTTRVADLAQLFSFSGSGGIAGVGGLCSGWVSTRFAFSHVFASSQAWYNKYSAAHEQGHTMGSIHTHDCGWLVNGKTMQKIDMCGDHRGYRSCTTTQANIPDPPGGGTIMSYCPSINFSLGYGPQPGELIRGKIQAATCLQPYTP